MHDSLDQISSTVSSVISDFCKTSERLIFWDEKLHKNVDPFEGREDGILSAEWEFKARISVPFHINLPYTAFLASNIAAIGGATAHALCGYKRHHRSRMGRWEHQTQEKGRHGSTTRILRST
jgi:hypothetical protein